MFIESVMPSSHLILRRPLLLLPSIPPSIRVFSNVSTFHMRWPKYWSFSFSISPSNEHPGLIPFRMDWLDLLAVQGTLKSLLQHHHLKASILQRSAFFKAQTSHLYMNQAPPSLGFSRQEHWSGLPFPSPMHESEKWKWSHSVVSDSLWPHGLQPTRLLCPRDFPGKRTGVGCHCLLQTRKTIALSIWTFGCKVISIMAILLYPLRKEQGKGLNGEILDYTMSWGERNQLVISKSVRWEWS